MTPPGDGATEERLSEEDAGPHADGGAARAPDETTPPRRRLSFGIVGQTAVVVGLIGGVVGLVFTFFPGLRPGSKTTPPTADLQLASVNAKAPLREYLNSEGIPAGTLSPAALERLGVLATVHYTSSGLGDKELPLVVSLTSSKTGEVVCKHTYRIRAGSGAPLTFRSWSPFPATRQSAGGSYDLHVTLFPPDEQPPSLAAADENAIPGASNTGPPLPLDLC